MTRRARMSFAALATAALAVSTLAVAAPTATAGPAGSAGKVEKGKQHHATLSWRDSTTGTTARFRGLSVVSPSIIWAAGYDGVVLRTTNGGRTWASVGPAAAAEAGLQFRDIEATSASHAVAMTVGSGTDSRVYVTDNGGATWTEADRMTDPAGFYDCMAFIDKRRGLVVSDPVGGKLTLKATRDGGHTWTPVDTSAAPKPYADEYFFAGSGTCLSAGAGPRVYLGTGGNVSPGVARVFSSPDRGRTWSVVDTPVAASASSGIFSVRFRDAKRGIVVGGDYANPTSTDKIAAWTADGGRTWSLPKVPPRGYRSGSAYAAVKCAGVVAIAVGPTGSDASFDGGRTWSAIDDGSLDTVQCVEGTCWGSGADGRIAKLVAAR